MLNKGSHPPICHVSLVMCHESCVARYLLHVMCHVSRNICSVSPVICQFSKHRACWPMLSKSQNVHLCVCPCAFVFTFEVWFKRLFAPTSQMSNLFRDLEYFGKSNAKKRSQIWKKLLIKGVKSPRKKKGFLDKFCFSEQNFVGIGVSHSFNGLFAPTFQSPMCKLFRFL